MNQAFGFLCQEGWSGLGMSGGKLLTIYNISYKWPYWMCGSQAAARVFESCARPFCQE